MIFAKPPRKMSGLGAEVLQVPTDVTDEEQVERLFAAHHEKFGRIDILFNNAGAFDGGLFDELTTEDWDKVIARESSRAVSVRQGGVSRDEGAGRRTKISSQRRLDQRPTSATRQRSLFDVQVRRVGTDAVDGPRRQAAWNRRQLLASRQR